MRLCWATSRFPELNHLTAEQRQQLLGKIRHTRVTVHLIAQGVTLGVVGGLVVGFGTLDGTVAVIGSTSELLIRSACALVVAGVVGCVVYQVQLHRIRSEVRSTIKRELEGERVPVCLNCGYDVQGARDPRCPECGAGIVVPRGGEAGGDE
jgi:DNA-directed RNA polymerase subunit RPC12/RpoP